MKNNLEEILKKKKAKEKLAAGVEAEKLRQSYLRRTGRKEMKP